MSGKAILDVRDLEKTFARGAAGEKAAVRGVSLQVAAGECVGLVGESGSGKSTIANVAAHLEAPDAGTVLVDGTDYFATRRLNAATRRALYRTVQMIFQNPASSFDPRRTLGASVAEPLRNAGAGRSDANARAAELFAQCGLDWELAERYPREVSGGQCQRAAIARALAVGPKLLICDEATSALDVTVQRQIVGLLARLRAQTGMAMLFICHDLALVHNVCDRVVVLKDGLVVEQGAAEEILRNPRADYTKQLLTAAL